MMKWKVTCLLLLLFLLFYGCSKPVIRKMEVTGYCGCGKCCGWERGSWNYLKLNFWNRYVSVGKRTGQPYTGRTASGTKPHEPVPGLFSIDSLIHPWMIPIRIIFPWLWLAKDGSIAADTFYYPFGTRLYISDYGYARVEDRGGAIKGKYRLDAFFNSHQKALNWGRKKIDVQILK